MGDDNGNISYPTYCPKFCCINYAKSIVLIVFHFPINMQGQSDMLKTNGFLHERLVTDDF